MRERERGRNSIRFLLHQSIGQGEEERERETWIEGYFLSDRHICRHCSRCRRHHGHRRQHQRRLVTWNRWKCVCSSCASVSVVRFVCASRETEEVREGIGGEVCVCVCVYERETGREIETEHECSVGCVGVGVGTKRGEGKSNGRRQAVCLKRSDA